MTTRELYELAWLGRRADESRAMLATAPKPPADAILDRRCPCGGEIEDAEYGSVRFGKCGGCGACYRMEVL
jgi:hypothetical protein